MKKKVALLTLCLFFAMVTNALSADEITIKFPFAFMDRFPDGTQHLGCPKGNVFQVGGFITHAGSPIKDVTVKNLDTGVVLTATLKALNIGAMFSGLYQVFPMPAFDPSKHMGVWEIRVKDEKGNEAVAKTHKMDMKGKMPFLKGLKASGNPLAPMIMWSAPSEKDIPQGARVRYQVRLLKDLDNQFYRSGGTFDTNFQIPEGVIKAEDLSKIYVRVECQGWDKNDSVHPLPLELNSQTFMPLKEALGKQ
jgi:hypothetical protein